MSFTIDKSVRATPALLEGINHLLPQLSSTAVALDMSDLERMIDSSSTTLFVASTVERIVGLLTLVVFAMPSGVRAWIEDVVVDENFRGTGIGEKLTMAAIAEARARGARSLDLTSRPSREPANALYRKLGFSRRETNVYRLSL